MPVTYAIDNFGDWLSNATALLSPIAKSRGSRRDALCADPNGLIRSQTPNWPALAPSVGRTGVGLQGGLKQTRLGMPAEQLWQAASTWEFIVNLVHARCDCDVRLYEVRSRLPLTPEPHDRLWKQYAKLPQPAQVEEAESCRGFIRSLSVLRVLPEFASMKQQRHHGPGSRLQGG